MKDLYSKELVGYSIGARMTADLVTTALRMAIARKKQQLGLIVHSDRGSQYCSQVHRHIIEEHGFTGSMSRKGEYLDNAPIESFWSRLKDDEVPREKYRSRLEAKERITRYIDITYNCRWIQAELGYRTPAETAVAFERAKAA